MEHEELLKERERFGTITVQERIQLAQQRRREQLLNYIKWISEEEEVTKGHSDQKGKKVKFDLEVQLTEAILKRDLRLVLELLNEGKKMSNVFDRLYWVYIVH